MAKKKSLVIVESPTKAKTIGNILKKDFSVVSSMGHLIDLPKSKLGVDIEKEFKPTYVVVPGRAKILETLKKESRNKNNIYIATDPDREGEAIGWHIKQRLGPDKKFLRVVFHEITPAAIQEAFKNPRKFDVNMVNAQQARRVLDRLVGYFLSPLLWRKLARGLSAGRVQSVALRLIIERERQILNFVPQEYWEIEAELKKASSLKPQASSPFLAKLEKIEDKKAEIKNKDEAEGIVADINGKQFKVTGIAKKEKKRYPDPPFITSTLQQEAFNKLRFNAAKTMVIAQQLYEGIDIAKGGSVGLITYMRTDSTHIAAEAMKDVRDFIARHFGKDYLPENPNVYKLKKHSQAAHEAIRPTLPLRAPESLRQFLTPDQYKLYGLIYNRFIASQMMPARYLVTTISIQVGPECSNFSRGSSGSRSDTSQDNSIRGKYLFVASGTTVIFDGFTAVYDRNDNKEKNILPLLQKDEILTLIRLTPSQHFTKPPARFSDSTLVKVLEEEGIGRPSTYVPIISTLILRDYARRVKGYFHPTELGFKVCDLLVKYFPKVMDVKFTALMEEELDEIEEAMLDKVRVLNDFYVPFKSSLDFAQANIKKEIIKTDEICDKCGKPMIIKWGRRGKFLSCSDYPVCKNAKSITSGVKCPQPDCGGELIERRSRRGVFYGCSNFPKCTFTSQKLPSEADTADSGT